MSDDEGLLLTRIVIERRIGEDGEDTVTAEFVDGNGDTPRLVEILGMLSMTQDTAIRTSMGEGEEE